MYKTIYRKFLYYMINESFNIKNGQIAGQDGRLIKIAYIDPAQSEGTYEHKDIIKNRYDGKWLKTLKTWGWFLGTNPTQVYQTKIKPCLQYLESVAKVGPRRGPEEIVSIIDQLIAELQATPDTAAATPTPTAPAQPAQTGEAMDRNEVIQQLDDFKQQLVDAVSSEDFKRLIEPIIKFKRAQGHKFSFGNALLIMLQDPEATLVKSKSRWAAMNKNVKPDAPKLWARVPVGNTVNVDKAQVTRNFLASVHKNNVEELNPGEKEELSIRLKPTSARSFKLVPCFYDYRFTEQMEGKEDLVGDPNADVPWYDDSGEETEESIKYVEAMKRVIAKSGVRVTGTDDLNGARGVSVGGEIRVLNSAARNMGLLNTLVHEFAHEILHQRYLKNRGQRWADYFVGTESGREVVEQQAELTAWIVLKFLGYDLQTNINYMGIWGISTDNTRKVFDSVASVANEIYSKLIDEVTKGDSDYGYNGAFDDTPETLEEDAPMQKKTITGREIAQMLGCVDLYDKCTENGINAINESFNKMYNRILNPIDY